MEKHLSEIYYMEIVVILCYFSLKISDSEILHHLGCKTKLVNTGVHYQTSTGFHAGFLPPWGLDPRKTKAPIPDKLQGFGSENFRACRMAIARHIDEI